MRERYKVRIDTWNVGTLTGRRRELAEVSKKRKDHIMVMVRKFEWKGEKAK